MAFYWAEIEDDFSVTRPALRRSLGRVTRVSVLEEEIDAKSGMAAGDAIQLMAEEGVAYEPVSEFIGFYLIELAANDYVSWASLTRARRWIGVSAGRVLTARRMDGFMYEPAIGHDDDAGRLRPPRTVCRRPEAGSVPQVLRGGSGLTPIEARLYDALLERDLDFSAQTPVRVGGRTYRVDFMLHARNGMALVVEVDGAQFHSSPDQRRRDYERQRALDAAGYRILRFTGSEVQADAHRCAATVRDRLRQLAQFAR